MPVAVLTNSSCPDNVIVKSQTRHHQQQQTMIADLTSILSIKDVKHWNKNDQEPPQFQGIPAATIRGVAQIAVKWYRWRLNPHKSNETNVQTVLRTVIAHLTTEVLLLTSSHQSNNNKNNKGQTDDNNAGPGSSPSSSHSSSSSSTVVCPLSRRHQARMEAFLTGCTLAVPTTTTTTGGGVRGEVVTTTKKVLPYHSQIPAADLQVRIELYLRSLQRFVRESSSNINVSSNNVDECVLGTEPDKDIRARARVTTNAFVATATYVGNNVTTVLTRLLVCLTKEVLAIEHVSEQELVETIIKRRVVPEYNHGTSFASLAFLSTPEVHADTLLTPLIVKYLKMLQSDWKRFVKECEMERLIVTQSTLQTSTRSHFKTIEFQSIGHLLEVCHEYRSELQDIQLPLSDTKNFCAANGTITGEDAVSSSVRHLKRQVITLNGTPLPPVAGSTSDLVEVLTTAILNADSVAWNNQSRERNRPSTAEKKISGQSGKAQRYRRNQKMKNQHRRPLQLRGHENRYDDESSTTLTSDGEFSSNDEEGVPKTTKQKEIISRADASTLALAITSKLLHCVTRTGRNGSAFYIVKDLFGGDSVRVFPTTTSMNHILQLRNQGFNGSLAVNFKEPISDQKSKCTITMHECFDIYPESMSPEAGYCEPLVQFHTRSEVTINRGRDSEMDSNTVTVSIHPSIPQEF